MALMTHTIEEVQYSHEYHMYSQSCDRHAQHYFTVVFRFLY